MRDDDLEREIRSHLESEIEELKDRGLSADDAQSAANRQFGNVAQVKEQLREMRRWVFLDQLKQDAAYAWRGMRRNPGFALAAVISLALGIGANTAIFTLVNAMMLRALPVPNPQELVQLTLSRLGPAPVESFPYPIVQALADHREIFSHLCGFTSSAKLVVGWGDSAEGVGGAWVTGEYYPTLGIQPEAGRLIAPSDDQRGAVPVAVITDGFWQRKFARDPRTVGQAVLIEGKPVTIIGVTPPGFIGATVGDTAEITIPIGAIPQIHPDWGYVTNAGTWWLRILARPQPGMSIRQVKARVDVAWRAMPQIIPANSPGARSRVAKAAVNVVAGGTGGSNLRQQFREPLLVLMAITGLLLLISCANVANLLLARATVRRREIGVRMAIGAGRARVIRQLLTESVFLSLAGAAAGVAMAWAGSQGLVGLLSVGRPVAIMLDVTPDLHVLAFTAGAALFTGILFGLAPAFQGTAAGPAAALRDKINGLRSRVAPMLVTVQLSLTLSLLIGAGLFAETLRNLETVDTGFRTNGVFLFNADGMHSGYHGIEAAAFYDKLLDEVERLPGVESAGFSTMTPLAGGIVSYAMTVNGVAKSPEDTRFNSVSRRYFETMGTPLVLGREFDAHDNATSLPVAIVNQEFAAKYLHGSPIGQRLRVGTEPTEYEIVGVVRNSIYETLRNPAPPTVFVPVIQRAAGWLGVMFEVRGRGSLAQIAATIRRAVQPVLPGAPVVVRTLNSLAEISLVRERLMATLAASFGVLGLTLAVVGLYGLLAYTVTRRTSEIGVRMALGATQDRVLWMVIRDALVLLGAGVAIGLPAAWAASRSVSSMLFGLKPTDPWTAIAAMAVLTLAGLLAGLPPAWRASRVDPMTALRYE